MPIFEFEADTGETITRHLTLNEAPLEYQRQIVDGIVYKRVYSAFNVGKETSIHDGSSEDFRRRTEGKNVTVGDMWEASGEAAERRKALNGGRDPIAEKRYEEYKRKKGKDHPDVVRRDGVAKLKEKYGVSIDTSRKIEQEI